MIMFEKRNNKDRKKMNRNITGVVVLTALILVSGLLKPVLAKATETTQKPVLALGADLTQEQKNTVFALMEIDPAALDNYTIITITNDMEHKYLDGYMSSSVIGTKSLSSVLIVPRPAGNGVVVTTKNITYCTTGMYRNALLTAGVQDADVLVAAPTQLSGTAALIGAIKGYEALSGESVDDAKLDTAMDELITTGELLSDTMQKENVSPQDVEALIAFVKAKVAGNNLSNEEDIEKVITEGEQQFGVTLDDSEKKQIVDVMQKINKLGIDPNVLIDQASDLYSQFGNDFWKHIDGTEIAKAAAGGIFSKIADSVKKFFAGLFK